MDSKELYKLIEKPKSLSEKQIEALNKIIQDHPYFASARLLEILDLIRKKDPKVHQEMRKSSLFIHDKKSIYDEILKIEEPKEEEIPTISKGPVGIGLGENKIEKNDFTDEILDEITIIGEGVKSTVLESFTSNDLEEAKQDKSTEKPTKTNQTGQKEDSKSTVEVQKKEAASPKEIKEEKSQKAKEIEQNKTSPVESIKKEDSPAPKKNKKEGDTSVKRSLADEVMENLEQMKKDRAERLKRMEALEKKEKERKAASSTKSKTATKKAQKKKKEETPSQEKQKPKSSKTKKAPKAKNKPKTAKKKVETEPKKESKPKSDKKIIESFINKNPRIQAPKESTSTKGNEDLSKASTELPSNLISENLANIFEKQGKISKAIAIYKQLILKYPEKKSYFAQKLENLEK